MTNRKVSPSNPVNSSGQSSKLPWVTSDRLTDPDGNILAIEQLTFTCTSTEAVNDFVYISANDTVAQARADNSAKLEVIGWIASKTGDTTCHVKVVPSIAPGSSLTAGYKIYLSNTPGQVSTTPGTYTVELGVAVNTTQFLFNGAKVLG